MTKKSTNQKIYLASKSPRRRELLEQIGVSFDVLMLRDSTERPIDVPEHVIPGELAKDYVTRITNEKAQTAWNVMMQRNLPIRPILTADTAVVLDGVIYGKPATPDEARMMLARLSGQTHQVLTSIAVTHYRHHRECTQTSAVTFCTLSKDQIDRYCDSSEPYDKAGSYAIQGHAAQFISHISGSYSGIMGLPLFETAKLLSEIIYS
ncbi:MAG: septum formation inhibitor Maf [Solimicrobium sp.]|jgi:septum formation protein|nr:septum formation inhibitor Maf [Solimicrobium sp.]